MFESALPQLTASHSRTTAFSHYHPLPLSSACRSGLGRRAWSSHTPCHPLKRRSSRANCQSKAASQAKERVPYFGPGQIKEIPVFPLGIVSFPTATVPLNIFEARYRVLFNTLLAGLPGIEEDLVNDQKAWCGSRLFGMCFVNQDGSMATTGTTLFIYKHERLPDGRLLVVNKGVEKFRVLKVLEERPVLVCRVEMLEDEEGGEDAAAAAQETLQLFRDLIQLNVRMKRIPSREVDEDPQLEGLSPREISYWLALVFSQSPILQQTILEESNVLRRLSQEKEILEGTTRYLRAQVALQSAFSADSEESSGSGAALDGPQTTSRTSDDKPSSDSKSESSSDSKSESSSESKSESSSEPSKGGQEGTKDDPPAINGPD